MDRNTFIRKRVIKKLTSQKKTMPKNGSRLQKTSVKSGLSPKAMSITVLNVQAKSRKLSAFFPRRFQPMNASISTVTKKRMAK